MSELFDPKTLEENSLAHGLWRLGEMNGARSILLALSEFKFGPMTPEDKARIEAIDDLSRLEALCLRLLEVTSWEELLAAGPST